MSTCSCPTADDCAGVGSTACAIAETFRKAPQTLVPTCGDLDATGNVVIGPDGDALCVVHAPVDSCTYRASVGVSIQKSVDIARKRAHVLGLRPYRVSIVWQRRNRRQTFDEFRRIELMPVTVSPLTGVDRELSAVGLDQVGGVVLTGVSPNQVNETALRGQITQGQPLASDEQFFYEVVRIARFAGEQPERARFTLGSLPHYSATKYQWEIELVSQHAERTPEGTDQSFEPARGRSRRLEVLRR